MDVMTEREREGERWRSQKSPVTEEEAERRAYVEGC